MEKQIKTVWILTIITALLIIGGQAYRLYNQYGYSADEHMRNLHAEILKLENAEFEARYKQRTVNTPMTLSYSIEMPDLTNSKGNSRCVITLYEKFTQSQGDSLAAGAVDAFKEKEMRRDTFSVPTYNIPSELIFEATSRFSTELSFPLTVTRLDSLFEANHITATDIRQVNIDSTLWRGTYHSLENLFPPRMLVTYPYNPLVKQAMTAIVTVPVNPLLKQMMWQLTGSILLVLVLVCCLVYQIKTILKQRKIDEMRKSFVNTMIHELKRPVQTLKMCVAFLNNKSMRTDEAAMDEVLKDSMFEIDNLSAYLAKVRDMTRADYEHTPLNIRTFDVCETIQKLIRLCNIPAGKNVVITPHFAMTTQLVTADPVHLANIISNLLENAIKYSGSEVAISISCTLQAHTLTLAISDNGIGIPASEQSKIFDKFYRGNNIPDRNIPGIGLGLSYVRLLTEAHHGTITLTSQPGKGTTFVLCFPQ